MDILIEEPEWVGQFRFDDDGSKLTIMTTYKPNFLARFIWKCAGFKWRPIKEVG